MFASDLEVLITEVAGWVATDCALESSFKPFWVFLTSAWIILPESGLDRLEELFEPLFNSFCSRERIAKSSLVWLFTTRSAVEMFSGCSASVVELC